MRQLRSFVLLGASAFFVGKAAGAQDKADTSTHRTRLVTVEKGVDLEVLDWGGSGRDVILLAGLGNTAHVFDEFAPRVASKYHVYGITRRGYGRSSAPALGYEADQLGDDVLAVIDSLGLRKPVLAGHSQAGEELSSIGSRHPDKVAGLIYLDAGYDYAFYDESHGNFTIDINEMIRQLGKLRLGSGASAQERRQATQVLADTSMPAFLKWARWSLDQSVQQGGPVARPMARVPYAIIAGQRKYTQIHGPVLAIFASPPAIAPGAESDPEMRERIAEVDAGTEQQVRAFARGVPQARVVRIPRGDHYVFRSNEGEVLREMRAFISGLPSVPD